jgi:hypothetical protein
MQKPNFATILKEIRIINSYDLVIFFSRFLDLIGFLIILLTLKIHRNLKEKFNYAVSLYRKPITLTIIVPSKTTI